MPLKYKHNTTATCWDHFFDLYVRTAKSYHMANENENGRNHSPIFETDEFQKLQELYISHMEETVKRKDLKVSKGILYKYLRESIKIAKDPWENSNTIDNLCQHYNKKR